MHRLSTEKFLQSPAKSIQRPEFILSPLAAAGTLPSFYFHKRLAKLETQLVLAVDLGHCTSAVIESTLGEI
jgi:hypothetical protein